MRREIRNGIILLILIASNGSFFGMLRLGVGYVFKNEKPDPENGN